jgi:DNA-binding IclR family transcriptional regulator
MARGEKPVDSLKLLRASLYCILIQVSRIIVNIVETGSGEMSDTSVAEHEAADRNGGIQVIARAAAILRALKSSRSGLSLAQIAERVALPRSTVQRIVNALQDERLVIASSTGVGFRLGPELHALAEAAHYNIADALRPLLQSLAAQTGETVDLAVLRGGQMIFIDQVAGTQRLRAVSSVGDAFPLTDTANGKACLALMEDGEVKRLAQAELGSKAGAALLKRLMAEISTIRETGHALDLDEHTDGISAVGIAFRDLRGDCHAISIPAPSARFTANRASLIATLMRAKAQIPEILGM